MDIDRVSPSYVHVDDKACWCGGH